MRPFRTPLKRIARWFVVLLGIMLLVGVPQLKAFSPDDFYCVENNSCFYDPACSVDTGANAITADSGSLNTGVYILGDSITVKAETAYQHAFQAKGVDVTIDGSSSRSLSKAGIDGNKLSGMDAIAQDAGKISGVGTVVFALGTNGGTTKDSIAKAVQAVQKINSKVKIYWVDTISVGRGDNYNNSVIKPANQAIYGSAGGDYTAISWFKAVDPAGDPTNPTAQERDPNGYISNAAADLGVHPTDKGSKALADLVVGSVSNNSNGSGTPSAANNTPDTNGCCQSSSENVDAALSGSTPLEKIFNYFANQSDYGPIAAAGIVGNIVHESGGDPENIQNPGTRTKDPSNLGGSVGWGIVQWTPGSKVLGIAKDAGITDPIYLLSTQLKVLQAELDGKAGSANYKSVGDGIKAAKTPAEAADIFLAQFEAPADIPATQPDRERSADLALKQYGGGAGAGAATSTDASATSDGGNQCACPNPGTDTGLAKLDSSLKSLADQNGGKTAISVESLDGSSQADVSGDVQMPTRSSYKIYTAYATMAAIEDGRISWSTPVWNGKSVEDTMQHMIINSDNDAAAALRLNNKIGTPAEVTKLLQDKVGLSDKTVMGSGGSSNSNSRSTANDYVKFLGLLEKHNLPGVSKDANYEKLLGFMKQATTDGGSARDGIAAGVGSGTVVADKPGWAGPGVDPASNDVGIVYLKGNPYVIAILTNTPDRWDGVATIAKGVNDVLKSGQQSAGNTDPNCASNSGAAAGNAAQTAINYAWPDYHPAVYKNRKPSYVAAVAKSRYAPNGGIDCGGFVTTVMIESGVDPDYNKSNGPVSAQYQYLKSSGKYTEVHPSSTADLQPGDIYIQSNLNHTLMYVGKHPGFHGIYASASTGPPWRAPMADSNAALYTDGYWFRKN